MESILKYYDFSKFFPDKSNTFSENLICYSTLNDTHFLIFEKENTIYNLYLSRYSSKKSIGCTPPETLELLVANYDKSISEHRIILKKYIW
ncbi:hypothetical protein [Tenacibaculum sp. UWU-22]|uniref:hypothetical protein n=1 Tax=Tenacibaculum sp. UWU-22 TaxID=3234187 RepID=UPI0034DABBEF